MHRRFSGCTINASCELYCRFLTDALFLEVFHPGRGRLVMQAGVWRPGKSELCLELQRQDEFLPRQGLGTDHGTKM